MPDPCKLVVLTGFESFTDFEVNSSWEAARTFDGEEIGSFEEILSDTLSIQRDQNRNHEDNRSS